MGQHQFKTEMMYDDGRLSIWAWKVFFLNERNSLLYIFIAGLASGLTVDYLQDYLQSNKENTNRRSRRCFKKFFSKKNFSKRFLPPSLIQTREVLFTQIRGFIIWYFILNVSGCKIGRFTLDFLSVSLLVQYIIPICMTLLNFVLIIILIFKYVFQVYKYWITRRNESKLKRTLKEISHYFRKVFEGWTPKVGNILIGLSIINLYSEGLEFFLKQLGIEPSIIGKPMSFYKNANYLSIAVISYVISVFLGIFKPEFSQFAIRYLWNFVSLILVGSVRYVGLYYLYTSSFFVSLYNTHMLKNYFLISEENNPRFIFRCLYRFRKICKKVLFAVLTVGLNKDPNFYEYEYGAKEQKTETKTHWYQKLDPSIPEKDIELSFETSLPLGPKDDVTKSTKKLDIQSDVYKDNINPTNTKI